MLSTRTSRSRRTASALALAYPASQRGFGDEGSTHLSAHRRAASAVSVRSSRARARFNFFGSPFAAAADWVPTMTE